MHKKPPVAPQVASILRDFVGEYVQDQWETDDAKLAAEVDAMVRLETRLWEIGHREEDLRRRQKLEESHRTIKESVVTFKEFRDMLNVKVISTIRSSMGSNFYYNSRVMSFAQETSKVDLGEIIKLSVKELTDVELEDDARLVVLHRGFFERLTQVIDETPNRVLINYLVFR